MTPQIGFMQGRLSAPVHGKIQAFPWEHWEVEFAIAGRFHFPLMEWTLDQDRLYENPLLTPAGRSRIRALGAAHGVRVQSLTGDCFMQAPFYKATAVQRDARLAELRSVLAACADLGIRYVVVPLVDGGRIETPAQEETVCSDLVALAEPLRAGRVRIVFESEYSPARLAQFIKRFPADVFGINYDIGNSASLGYDPVEEIAYYGERILNVHVKDRIRGGTTVPLGQGNANFPVVFVALTRAGYAGDFILQTARASDGDHAGALCRYRDMVKTWLNGGESRA